MFEDYFRCPADFTAFEPTLNLSDKASYFQFHGATCFGRRETAFENAGRKDNGRLPFDLHEVVTNLRRERYNREAESNLRGLTGSGLARTVYYFLRPLLPVGVRKHLQKVRLSGWEKIEFPRWPVDFSVDVLMQEALALQVRKTNGRKIPFIWFWPEGAPSCAILTHDVEAKSGRDACGQLMDLDEEYGFKAAFQVVPEQRYEESRALCDDIRRRGFEVNVHDMNHDGRLFESRERFLERAARINEYARERQSRGFRAAAMYRRQDWFEAFEFSYDMSVPNVAHLEPQRGGCCTVMPYFIGDILELPLTTVQDYSLFHILDDYSTALWKTQIDLIRASNGLITLLTHPDYLLDERSQSVYHDLLGHVRRLREARSLWFALPSEVDSWWRDRSRMSIARSGDSWIIEGEGSARARLAFASLEGGELVYEVDGRVMRRAPVAIQ